MNLTRARNIKGGKASSKIKVKFGTSHYYNYYKKHKGVLERDPFLQILRECNKVIIEEVLESAEEYALPFGLGKISFRKRKNKARVVDGKVFSNALTDWKKTMELWESNPQAHRNRIKVKYTNMHTGRYSFRMAIMGRKFKNKEYFAFRFKRDFKRMFAKRIFTYNKPKIEAQITKTI